MKKWVKKHFRWLFKDEDAETRETLDKLASDEKEYKNALDFASQQLDGVERELAEARTILHNVKLERDH